MSATHPSSGVSPQIWAVYPEHRALSVIIWSYVPVAVPSALAVCAPEWLDAHIESWRGAFKRFCATPKRTLSSLESLHKRFERDDVLPTITSLAYRRQHNIAGSITSCIT